MSAHGFVAASRLQTTCFPNPHRTWGRRASWWMRSDDVPGPKHHIGQDPPNDDEDDNDRDDTCCTTTMTTLTDDRRLLRNATTATRSCLTVFSPVSRAIVFSCPLSLSLSPSVRPRSSWSGSELRCNMAANNLLSQPSLHLGPACQLVDEGKGSFRSHCTWVRRAS